VSQAKRRRRRAGQAVFPIKRPSLLRRAARSVLDARWFHHVVAWYLRTAIAFGRMLGRRRASALAAGFTRLISPLIPENRLGAANLAAAFPEKSEEERRAILKGVWDNLARMSIEFAFLDDIFADFNIHRLDRGTVTASGVEDFLRLREDKKPGLIFSAHLANWELPAVIARRFHLDVTILFRLPKNSIVAEDLMNRRNELMGNLVPSRLGTAMEIAGVLDGGGHVGMLVDQRRQGSPALPFFGRPALTSTLFARLARQYDCPVHGVRAIRKPGGNFHVELTPPIELPRDSEGLIDVVAASARINEIIEGWIREYPEQWLWVHDRWRGADRYLAARAAREKEGDSRLS
jgi:KDO2-lipid IV(A) lauroyltransferase